MDRSPPGSSVHGISQAVILEWIAISFSRGSSWPRDQTLISCIGPWVLYRQVPGKPDLWRYSPLNEAKSSIPLFNCRLCMVTSLQSEQYGKGEGKKRVIVQWRNLTNTTNLSRWSSQHQYMSCWYFVPLIQCNENVTLLLRSSSAKPLVESWEKHYTNSDSGTSYNITWPLLLKTDKVIKTKEILKKLWQPRGA